MTVIHKNALIPYSCEKMYDLVVDIERYHEFLPWCEKAEILRQQDDWIEGRISVKHLAFQQSFTTTNKVVKNQRIHMQLLHGPFRHLDGVWQFQALQENACKISLDMDFEFSSKLVSMALTPVFSQIANSMVDSFCTRATEIYN